MAFDAPNDGMYLGPNPTDNADNEPGNAQKAGGKDSTWIKLARDAYNRSTNYFDNNYRKKWEDDLRMFQSRHPRDSKYHSDNYRYRSKIFRPKSRSVVRKNEATAALAFFSNPDVVSISPVNTDDRMQAAGADLMQEVLNYRLQKSIPWFLTVVGGYQDAMTVGLVCSMQLWRYAQRMEKKTVTGVGMDGQEMTVEIDVPRILQDEPCVDLFPIENVRFDPAAHWYDVVKTSPYLVFQIPMYVNDVLDNMENEDRDGRKWKKMSKAKLLEARMEGTDPLRQARNDNRESADAVTSEVNEFDVVMVHLNFIRRGDTTWVYYTLKDQDLLSTPMPVEEMFLHCKDGRPPVQIGFCVLETHKPIPSSLIGLTAELQKETNEIANQRLDNVKFVLNKRWLIKRGSNVDVESLLRNVPGGVTMVNNVEQDALPVNWQDVTSSSYQEQDRINVDMDELAGNFAQGSVLTNRKLNETVGGMKMMSQGANALTEYSLRVFSITWVEPVLRQLVKLEAAYETDQTVLAIAGAKAKLMPKYGISEVNDALLNQELTLTVNVGQGATDPDSRLQRLTHAFMLDAQMVQTGPKDLDIKAMRKEIYGLSGFPDGALKYYEAQVDPRIELLQQKLQSAQADAQKTIDNAKFQLLDRSRQLDDREHNLEMQALQKQQDLTANMQEAIKQANIDLGESLNKQRIAAAEADNKMHLARVEAANRILIQNREADVKAGIDRMLAEQKAHNDRLMAAAKAPKVKSAKKVNGEWQITERTVQ